jgi:glycogen synthase
MKVLHCIYDHPANPWVGGGGAVRLFEIYARLAGEIDVSLAIGRFPGMLTVPEPTLFEQRALGARKPYPLSRLTYGVAATRLLARARYDAAVFDFSAYTPLRLPRDRPVGVMLGQLAGPTAARRWGRAIGGAVARWERSQLRRARHVAAVSPWLLETARPHLSPAAQTCVVGAGVDPSFFSVERHESDYLLYYGRFDIFQKGIDVLLHAWSRVLRARPHLRLRVAGRGRDTARIREMMHEQGLEGSVELIVAPDPRSTRALMAGALVLVMPSRFEGFGMVAAEAMAAGVPVVCSEADALPDVVGTEAGVLVPPGDADALAAAVLSLLDSPGSRARLSEAGRARARRYSWDRVARDHLAWLHRIAAGPATHPIRDR